MNGKTSGGASENPYSGITAVNPYQPSDSLNNAPGWGDHAQGKKFIREVARWQTFFAVLLSILLMFFAATFLFQIANDRGIGLASGLILGGAICLIFCGIPALLLWRASIATRKFVASESMEQFTGFAQSQAVFWRFIGILAIIVGIVYALIMIALVGTRL